MRTSVGSRRGREAIRLVCYAAGVLPTRFAFPVISSLVACLALATSASVAHAGKFGGFSGDGTRWLDGKSSICTAAAVDGAGQVVAPAACEPAVDARAVAAYKFSGPPRLKVAKHAAGGKVDLSIAQDGQVITVYGDAGGGKRPLAVFDAGQDVGKLSGPWLSADGALVAVEYTLKGGAKTAAFAVAFDVRASLAQTAPKPGGVLDRVLKLGTTWTQKQVPCEEAAVTLTLTKERRFTILIETRCEGSKDRLRVGGRVAGEEPDKLLLSFSNDDGPEEHLECRVAACEDGAGECIRCQSEDVGFVVKPKAGK
jgi:hypothetical protein